MPGVKYSSFNIRNFKILCGWDLFLGGALNFGSFLCNDGFFDLDLQKVAMRVSTTMSWPTNITQKINK